MKKTKQKMGLTLVSLVVTIIVLLILAGITISVTIGENGILKMAEKAGENYTDAADYERDELAELTNTMDDIIEGIVLPGPEGGIIVKTENGINYTLDAEANTIPVPVGFTPITTSDQGTKQTGFVIKNDNDGNEYVWVPVDDTTTYDYERVAFSRTGWAGTQTLNTTNGQIKRADYPDYGYTESIPSLDINKTELDSVTEFGGYYIGRYEVGVIGYSSTVATKNTTNATKWTGYSNGTAVVQEGKQPWNYITKGKAQDIAEGMYTNSDNVTSRLCSSYAWDTALKFIETIHPTYPTNSTEGNYTATIKETGKTTPVNNIYDMGGNIREWTTEYCDLTDAHNTTRGGGQSNTTASDAPAANRYRVGDIYGWDFIGFRTTLFL